MESCWHRGSIRNHNHLVFIVIIWMSTLFSIKTESTNKNEGRNNQQRTFGDYDLGIMPPTEHPNMDMEHIDYSMETPKFMSNDMHSHSNSKYNDYSEREYDHYGSPLDDYHGSSHDYVIPHNAPPHPPFMIMKPQQSMASKLTNLLTMDSLKILLIVLLKMLFIKLQVVGFVKLIILLLLKLPVLLFGFVMKILVIVKLTNLLKLITLPLFLPAILMFLAPILLPLIIPLLMLPLLLPLLLFLPIPILTLTTTTTSTTTTTAATPGRRRRRRYLDGGNSDLRLGLREYRERYGSKDGSYYSDLLYFKHVVESEQCLERIACRLASDGRATLFKSFIIRILETAKEYVVNSKLNTYIAAYKFGATQKPVFEKCVKYYPCSKFKS